MKRILDFYKTHECAKLTVLFLFCGFILFLRRPDALLNAQFWAEDGKIWFGEAYSSGLIESIFKIYAGSFQTMMRITGVVSLIVPFRLVPLFFTMVALTIKVLPLLLIHSRRFAVIFNSKKLLWSITFVYLLLANSAETHLNLTNIGWHLSLVGFLIIIAPTIKNWSWGILDKILLTTSVLTGPFSLFLLPIAFLVARNKKSKSTIINLAIVSVGALIQLIILFLNGMKERGTTTDSLGASPELFVELIGRRVFATSLFGNDIALRNVSVMLLLPLVITSTSLLLYALLKTNSELKMFIIFSWTVFFAALISPAMGGSWEIQLNAVNDRYWYIPSLSFLIVLVSMLANIKLHNFARFMAMILLVPFIVFGTPTSFFYKERDDLDFRRYSIQFENARQGETVCIPVNPDSGWLTCLEKK